MGPARRFANRFGFHLVGAFAAMALAAPAALAGDIVINTAGRPQGNSRAQVPPVAGDFAGSEWEIVEENMDGITYTIPGVPQPQPMNSSQIKEIHHDPALTPPELARGEGLLARDDFAGARAALKKAMEDPESPPWARAKAAYLLSLSWYGGSDYANAEKALAAFKTQFPKSRWLTAATDYRAKALMALERIADAKEEYKQLQKLPGVPEPDAIDADFWLVWIDEQIAVKNNNDPKGLADAMRGYEALITKLQGKTQFAATLRRAQVGRASCLIALGKAPEARVALEKLLAETQPSEQRARAAIFNKLGTATWRAAPADRTEQKAALLHFLRVVALYGDAEGAEEDCAEAMFHAGELFRELKDTQPDYIQRARREWNEVKQRFPGSVWAKRANEALGGR